MICPPSSMTNLCLTLHPLNNLLNSLKQLLRRRLRVRRKTHSRHRRLPLLRLISHHDNRDTLAHQARLRVQERLIHPHRPVRETDQVAHGRGLLVAQELKRADGAGAPFLLGGHHASLDFGEDECFFSGLVAASKVTLGKLLARLVVVVTCCCFVGRALVLGRDAGSSRARGAERGGRA
jgi:hypothetical protein